MTLKPSESLLVSDEEEGLRIDQLLSNRFPDYSRSYFQSLIEESHVLLNGSPIKKRLRPQKDDEIEVSFQLPPQIDLQPEDIPLDILFEDDHLIAVNKPPGMVVHPAPGAYEHTFAAALLHHCKTIDRDQFSPLRPGIVHRLDKETSGVLIAAKTIEAHQKVSKQFAERELEKIYLAITCGPPKEGILSAPIKRHPVKRKQMCIDENGKEAISEFSILRKAGELCLVQVKLHTGRTHQIRVHLKDLKAPVLGDSTYGSESLNRKYGAKRQLLHAQTLRLTHPITGCLLELTAECSSDMKNFIDQIDRT